MDPISDMFIRIKNAQRAGHETVQFPYSKYKHEIAKALERKGYIGGVERKGKRIKKTLELVLQYREGDPLMHDVRLISKPSRRLYMSYKELQVSPRGGVLFVSTPKGVLASDEARKEKVGGELIAEIW
ncbi:MAG: 30S ribosomal protein S8 [Candidatus Sungbacteria bacterium]|nr:30S ribosomal protein S8 [Candidatus Sungbacteria bacterium]